MNDLKTNAPKDELLEMLERLRQSVLSGETTGFTVCEEIEGKRIRMWEECENE